MTVDVNIEEVINELTRVRDLAENALKLLSDLEPRTTFSNGVCTTKCPVCGSVLSTTTHCIPE